MSHQVVIFQCRNYVKCSWYCILCKRIHIFFKHSFIPNYESITVTAIYLMF